jgi:hypothetical protein
MQKYLTPHRFKLTTKNVEFFSSRSCKFLKEKNIFEKQN